MPMVRLDDDGAARGVIVLVDVPLRHVDQVMVAQATGRTGHARQAKVGAIGQEGGKQGRQVGGRVAGAQMGEAGGEPRGQRDILHNLGDAHPRQHAVEASGHEPRGVGHRWLGACDVEGAVLDLDAVQLAARGAGSHELQALVQQAGPGRDVALGVSFAGNADRGRPGRLRREQVILEGAMIAAAGDPHARATQALA